jgi:type 1 glutamine amidotransferase
MRLLTSILAATLLPALTLTATAADTPAPPKLKVLLVTGDDVMPAHHWPSVAAATRDILEQSGKFEVRTCEDAGIFDSASSLKTYDLVFFALYNAKTPPISDTAKENLLNHVRSGKGFAIAHLASASYKDWPEFRKLCGRYWVMGTSGHGPRSKFKVRIAAPSNPIVKGLSDFEADDELYAKLQGDVPVTVLAEADSDWSKKTEPLAFTLSYGQGRVFHEAFGHDKKALDNPAVRTLIVRGCQWAATGQVTD